MSDESGTRGESILDRSYQVIWARSLDEWALGFMRFEPPSALATVYTWAVIIGPLEIRRWAKSTLRSDGR